MGNNFVKTSSENGITTILLNDPAKRNAFSKDMAWEFADILEKLTYDDTTKVIIIRGAENNFCGGGDVKYMKEKMELLEAGKPLPFDPIYNMRRLNSIITQIRTMGKPVIAWMEGAVAGAGVSLAMACDFSIAQEDCKILFAFAGIGLMPDMGSTYLLSQRVGLPKATELFMTAKPFSGRDAADWGIITDALPSEQVEERVMKLANKLAKGPTQAYAKIKDMLNKTALPGLQASMETEIVYQNILNKTQDHKEAVTAFLEKRRPEFIGK